MAKSYRIFPSIGIARVGNSTQTNLNDGYYLADSAWQQNFVPPAVGQGSHYRDSQGKIKRMGQRFRIYEFENETPVREITDRDAVIQWNVRLVNSKAAKDGLNQGIARQNLTIDTGTRTIRGANLSIPVSGQLNPTGTPFNVKLGDLLTDEHGRLTVLGGHGNSATWNGTYPGGIQNNGWYDDTSDGPVGALLQLRGSGEVIEAESAWVIVGVADFAHPVVNIVTLYDLAQNAAQQFNVTPLSVEPSFTRDIFPVLHRSVFMQWASSSARYGHADGPGNFLDEPQFKLMHDKKAQGAAQARAAVFNRLRNPSDPFGSGNMPDLAGGLSLTPYQYGHFAAWKEGNFVDDWNSKWNPYEPPEADFDSLPVTQQPDALNRAALGSGVGGSFNPGIEADYRIGENSTYQRPFRVARTIPPGGLTQALSVPWQADYKLCTEVWWPGGRPGSVLVGQGSSAQPKDWTRGIPSTLDMVKDWNQLGFIMKDNTSSDIQYTEQERTLASAARFLA